MKTTVTPNSICPYCGHKFNRASNPEGQVPTPGDYSVCIECSEILVFDDDLLLRKPTDKELEDVPLDSLSKIQNLLRKARGFGS